MTALHEIEAADMRFLADFPPGEFAYVVMGTFFNERIDRGLRKSYAEAKERLAELHEDEMPLLYRHDGKTWKRTH